MEGLAVRVAQGPIALALDIKLRGARQGSGTQDKAATGRKKITKRKGFDQDLNERGRRRLNFGLSSYVIALNQ